MTRSGARAGAQVEWYLTDLHGGITGINIVHQRLTHITAPSPQPIYNPQ